MHLDIDSSEIYSEIEQDISDLIESHIQDNQQEALDSDEVQRLIEGSRDDLVQAYELDSYVSTTILDIELNDIKDRMALMAARIDKLETIIATAADVITALAQFTRIQAIVNPAPEA